ncbi:MAG: hypothetical protein JJLCMIEE_00714 [Acidimicrobiales bacterium]|nr:hypothetical protein [Acidimicrobiales bacterium]
MARLLDAGMTVLNDRGYHAARVDDIVRAADASHGTFYLYFANKEDLVRALAEECAGEMTELAGSLGRVEPGPEGYERLRSWLERFHEVYARYGAVIRAWVENQSTDSELRRLGASAFGDMAARLVTQLEESGYESVDAEMGAAALLAMVERMNYFMLQPGTDWDEAVVLDTLAMLTHRGFFAGQGSGSRIRLGQR